MSMTDPIADMLTSIRNGYLASKNEVVVPYSKLKRTLADKLQTLGYLSKVEEDQDGQRKVIKIDLHYEKGRPEIEGLKRVSKPGLRIYRGKKHLQGVYGGLGHAIISTNVGLLTDKEARKKQVGGEIICEVW
ncbi:MAG TPA: 30S ribosomal protein S8 [Candidatus Nanoarchaeia archaeon]